MQSTVKPTILVDPKGANASLLDRVLIDKAFQRSNGLSLQKLSELSKAELKGAENRGEVSLNPTKVLSNNSASLVAQGGGLLANNGSGLVAQGGGLLANNGSGAVASDGRLQFGTGAAYRLSQALERPVALAYPTEAQRKTPQEQGVFRRLQFTTGLQADLYRSSDANYRIVFQNQDRSRSVGQYKMDHIQLSPTGEIIDYHLSGVGDFAGGVKDTFELKEKYNPATGESVSSSLRYTLFNKDGGEAHSFASDYDFKNKSGVAFSFSSSTQMLERYDLALPRFGVSGAFTSTSDPLKSYFGQSIATTLDGKTVRKSSVGLMSKQELLTLMQSKFPDFLASDFTENVLRSFDLASTEIHGGVKGDTAAVRYHEYPGGVRILLPESPGALCSGLALIGDDAYGFYNEFSFSDGGVESYFISIDSEIRPTFATVAPVVEGKIQLKEYNAMQARLDVYKKRDDTLAANRKAELMALDAQGNFYFDNLNDPRLNVFKDLALNLPSPGAQRMPFVGDFSGDGAYFSPTNPKLLVRLNLQDFTGKSFDFPNLNYPDHGPSSRLANSLDGTRLLLSGSDPKAWVEYPTESADAARRVALIPSGMACHQVLPATEGGYWLLDKNTHSVHRLNAQQQVQFSVKGNADRPWDGLPAEAGLAAPDAIALDDAGGVFVAEPSLGSLRHIDAQGFTTTVLGTGKLGLGGFVDGAALIRLPVIDAMAAVPEVQSNRTTLGQRVIFKSGDSASSLDRVVLAEKVRVLPPPETQANLVVALFSTAKLPVGSVFASAVGVRYQNGLITREYTAVSDKPEVVKLAEDGRSFEALAPGTATLRFTAIQDPSLTEEMKVTVIPKP